MNCVVYTKQNKMAKYDINRVRKKTCVDQRINNLLQPEMVSTSRQVTFVFKTYLSDWDLLPYRLYEASHRLFRISNPAALSTVSTRACFYRDSFALIPPQATKVFQTHQIEMFNRRTTDLQYDNCRKRLG